MSSGTGRVTVGDGAWTSEYSFASRFDDGAGTNAEELIAAAHAGCFSMALCHMLTKAGHPPRSIETVARVHLRLVDGAPTIQQVDLETQGDAPGLDEERFRELSETARRRAPSRGRCAASSGSACRPQSPRHRQRDRDERWLSGTRASALPGKRRFRQLV